MNFENVCYRQGTASLPLHNPKQIIKLKHAREQQQSLPVKQLRGHSVLRRALNMILLWYSHELFSYSIVRFLKERLR